MTALLWAAGAAAAAVLTILWRLLSVAKKSGVDAQKAKEAEARDQNIKRLKDAIDAGSQPLGKLPDKHDRDQR